MRGSFDMLYRPGMVPGPREPLKEGLTMNLIYLFSIYFLLLLYFEVFPSLTPQIPLPTIVKSFQDVLLDHKNDIEHILYGYISRNHEFWRRTFSIFFVICL